MKIVDPGHTYELEWLDGKPFPGTYYVDGVLTYTNPSRLTFVKREGAKYPGNAGSYPGTNMQEVLRALIDRIKYLDAQIRHDYNAFVLQNLRSSLFWLERRAAELKGIRNWPSTSDFDRMEELPFCKTCGHTFCKGECK